MSHAYDHEFEVPPEKGPGAEPPTSGLAIVSLVFSILGVTALPVLGSLVGVATGHASIGQIRESRGRVGGRSMAKAGLILGYIPIALATIGCALAMLIVSSSRVTAITEVVGASTRGVKMVNEMGRDDFDLIENSGFPVAGKKIIACYNSGRPHPDPEFALLTDQALTYLKDGHQTAFELADVVDIKGDQAYEQAYNRTDPEDETEYRRDGDTYHIEVREKDGPRMRINIEPEEEGPAFFDALESAWKAAAGRTKVQAE